MKKILTFKSSDQKGNYWLYFDGDSPARFPLFPKSLKIRSEEEFNYVMKTIAKHYKLSGGAFKRAMNMLVANARIHTWTDQYEVVPEATIYELNYLEQNLGRIRQRIKIPFSDLVNLALMAPIKKKLEKPKKVVKKVSSMRSMSVKSAPEVMLKSSEGASKRLSLSGLNPKKLAKKDTTIRPHLSKYYAIDLETGMVAMDPIYQGPIKKKDGILLDRKWYDKKHLKAYIDMTDKDVVPHSRRKLSEAELNEVNSESTDSEDSLQLDKVKKIRAKLSEAELNEVNEVNSVSTDFEDPLQRDKVKKIRAKLRKDRRDIVKNNRAQNVKANKQREKRREDGYSSHGSSTTISRRSSIGSISRTHSSERR